MGRQFRAVRVHHEDHGQLGWLRADGMAVPARAAAVMLVM